MKKEKRSAYLVVINLIGGLHLVNILLPAFLHEVRQLWQTVTTWLQAF